MIPGLPRSGEWERPPSHALDLKIREATASRNEHHAHKSEDLPLPARSPRAVTSTASMVGPARPGRPMRLSTGYASHSRDRRGLS